MNKANEDLRQLAKVSGVKLWEVADLLGYSDANYSRKMRKEFTEEEKTAFCKAVDQIIKQRAEMGREA